MCALLTLEILQAGAVKGLIEEWSLVRVVSHQVVSLQDGLSSGLPPCQVQAVVNTYNEECTVTI